MSNGKYERLAPTALDMTYGCVDWYSYDRHPAGHPPVEASRLDAADRVATEALILASLAAARPLRMPPPVC